MRRLVLKMHLSVDGFVGGPNGEVEWIFDSMDEAAVAWTVDTLWQAGVHIMGRRTFDDMAAHWPTSIEPYAPPMNEIPKAVFTRRGLAAAPPSASPHAAGWAAPRVAGGDLAEEIARMKREPGKDILAHGGAGFARSLVRRGLIDEYRLLVHPVALGSGLPLFSERAEPMPLRLLSATPFPGGAVAHVYRPAGRG